MQQHEKYAALAEMNQSAAKMVASITTLREDGLLSADTTEIRTLKIREVVSEINLTLALVFADAERDAVFEFQQERLQKEKALAERVPQQDSPDTSHG